MQFVILQRKRFLSPMDETIIEVDAPWDIYYRNEGSSKIIMRRAAFLCNA